MDPLAAIKVTFFQECEEQLAELEGGLLAMEGGDHDPEIVNAVFRAVHSIKGGAGAFSLEDLVRFSHVFETALDLIRSGDIQADQETLKLLLRSADVLADHVRAARDGGSVDEGRSSAMAEALEALASGMGGGGEADTGDGFADFVFNPVTIDMSDAAAPAPDLSIEDLLARVTGEAASTSDAPAETAGDDVTWHIRFYPQVGLYQKANESGLLLRELARLGKVEVRLDASGLPTLQNMNPEDAYLGWSVVLSGPTLEEASIREVFEWVEGDCYLDIVREGAAPAAAVAAGTAPAASIDAVGEVDVMALIRAAQAAEVPAAAMTPPTAAPRPAEAPAKVEPTKTREAALDAKAQAAAREASPQTIRVDLERVDRLIDLVGELVINQAMLTQRVAECGLQRASSVAMGLDDLEQLTREIQDSVMAIRAQPVKSVFQRFPRLVREIAAMTGKEVRLIMDGEGTEVDKTVIERLSDPLTHMIRNAIDHGLETPDEREAAGKPREGVVRLAALHRSGRIVIEISDDGRGINRPRVKQIAVDKGLISPEANLSDDEIDNLIFMAGFSTAATVSDISGRGVGMDVVRRSIQSLGGRINISSRPGQGSTFTLSLPLTLAVLDGMVVTVAGQTLVAPLTAIIESLQPKACDVRNLGPNAQVIAIRDTHVPLIDIGRSLGYRTVTPPPTEGVALLVEGEGGSRAALMVDAIQGQRQVVIKSLEANYRPVPGIAAATILGDGRVALILDIDAVMVPKPHEGLGAAPAPAGGGYDLSAVPTSLAKVG
jgi:two-component system chemotaxis sensor kinase CheA